MNDNDSCQRTSLQADALVTRHADGNRSDPSRRAPASFSQRRLWLLDGLLPVRAVYNVAHALRLSGEPDVDALRRVLNELVRWHEVLHTRFAAVDGDPVQEIAPDAAFAPGPQDRAA